MNSKTNEQCQTDYDKSFELYPEILWEIVPENC